MKLSDFVDRRPDVVGISKAGFKLANKVFIVIKQGRLFSRSGANHAKAEPLSNVPIRPIRDASVGYREGCIWMTKRTWLRNPWIVTVFYRTSQEVQSWALYDIFGDLILVATLWWLLRVAVHVTLTPKIYSLRNIFPNGLSVSAPNRPSFIPVCVPVHVLSLTDRSHLVLRWNAIAIQGIS